MQEGSSLPDAVRTTTTGTFHAFVPEQRVFNRYLIHRELGRGGRGVVYLAQDLRLFCMVALKFMADELVREPEALEELRHETLVSRKITHPFIMRIYDFEQDASAAAISMEYVEGDTLSQLRYKRESHCFDTEEIRLWMIQLAEALHYAHSVAGVVHRDLKPSNLMIDGSGRLKITDFGIASVIADSMSRATRTQIVSGTLPYMSPQQALGDLPRESDDIYSFGAVIYELLTSKPPFFRGNVAAQIHSASAPLMVQRRADLGRDGAPIPMYWEEIVASCLAKEPENRPQSAKAIAEWLEKGGRENDAGARGRGKGMNFMGARWPVVVASLAAVLLIAGFCLWRWLPPSEDGTAAASPTSSQEIPGAAGPSPGAAAPAPDASSKTSPIIVNTMPSGADVFLNGEPKGKSPLELANVGVGNWRLRVERPGYEDEELIVEVREDGTTQPPLIEMVRTTSGPPPTPETPSTPAPTAPTPPAAAPADPGPSPSDRMASVATKDEVMAVINGYIQAMVASDANAYASLCAPRVGYFDEGVRPKDYVRKSREFFGRMFSNYEVRNLRNVNIQNGGEPSTTHVSFTYDYSAKNLTAHTVNHRVVGPGMKRGTVTDTLDLRKMDGQWLITKMWQDKP